MPTPYRHLYDSANWRRERARFLALHQLCSLCSEMGRVTPATVVDHIQPHRGNTDLFWDRANWQPLCKTCHDSAKQVLERSGHLPGSRTDGLPLDPRHPWFKEGDE